MISATNGPPPHNYKIHHKRQVNKNQFAGNLAEKKSDLAIGCDYHMNVNTLQWFYWAYIQLTIFQKVSKVVAWIFVVCCGGTNDQLLRTAVHRLFSLGVGEFSKYLAHKRLHGRFCPAKWKK